MTYFKICEENHDICLYGEVALIHLPGREKKYQCCSTKRRIGAEQHAGVFWSAIIPKRKKCKLDACQKRMLV